jgi:hypothetical protein
LELYERDGWKALGYDSWQDCVVKEFGKSKSYLYRQLAAAKVELLICPSSQVGEIREAKLRPLSPLPDEEKLRVWDQATVGGMISPSTARVTELANKALDGLSPEAQRDVLEESEEKIIRRSERKRRKETTKQLLDWLEKYTNRALHKINASGLGLKPIPLALKKLQLQITKVRVRLFGRKAKTP